MEYIAQDKRPRICKWCKICFEPKTSNQVYCTKWCNTLYFRDKYYRNKNKSNYFRVLERDKFRCAYCGRTSYKDKVKLSIDHVRPLSSGGKSISSNLIIACIDCNSLKYNNILSEDVLCDIIEEVEIRNESIGFTGKEIIKL